MVWNAVSTRLKALSIARSLRRVGAGDRLAGKWTGCAGEIVSIVGRTFGPAGTTATNAVSSAVAPRG